MSHTIHEWTIFGPSSLKAIANSSEQYWPSIDESLMNYCLIDHEASTWWVLNRYSLMHLLAKAREVGCWLSSKAALLYISHMSGVMWWRRSHIRERSVDWYTSYEMRDSDHTVLLRDVMPKEGLSIQILSNEHKVAAMLIGLTSIHNLIDRCLIGSTWIIVEPSS